MLLKYSESVTIDLVFYDPITQSFQNAITWASGDVKIIKDGVDSGNSTNTPTLISGRNVWRLTLTATEMQAKIVSLEFVNDDIVDTVYSIQTFGHASAGIVTFPASLESGAISSNELNNIADNLLKRDFIGLTGEATRSVLNALRFIVNRKVVSSGVLTVYKENDSTTAWTANVSTDTNAEPVVSVDPN